VDGRVFQIHMLGHFSCMLGHFNWVGKGKKRKGREGKGKERKEKGRKGKERLGPLLPRVSLRPARRARAFASARVPPSGRPRSGLCPRVRPSLRVRVRPSPRPRSLFEWFPVLRWVPFRACAPARVPPSALGPVPPRPSGRARACAPARVRPSASVLRACPSVAVIRARPSGAATYILRTHHFKDPSIALGVQER
jgi:hypothetical protein